MSIEIDWATYVITIHRDHMLLIQSTPIEIRQLDLTSFHTVLRAIEDDPLGIPHPDTHRYSSATEISGVVLALVVELLEPYTITFDDGLYAVNITGGNSNLADRVNINNVGVRTANSAGLQDLSALQASSFSGGGVTIDATSLYSGLTYPVGTRQYPVNNTVDAIQIARSRGLKTLNVVGFLELSSVDFSEGFIFYGDNVMSTILSIQDGANVSNCEFQNMTVTGIIDNNNLVRQSAIGNVTHVNGFMFQSGLVETVTLGGGIQATILDCYDGVATLNHPTIDMGGSGQNLALRSYTGGLIITNCTDPTVVSTLDFKSGELIIDSTVTEGTFYIRGNVDVTDNSGPNAIIINESINTQLGKTLTRNQFIALK